jgi:hypothetical protein
MAGVRAALRGRRARAYRGPTFGGLVIFLTLVTFLHRPVRARRGAAARSGGRAAASPCVCARSPPARHRGAPLCGAARAAAFPPAALRARRSRRDAPRSRSGTHPLPLQHAARSDAAAAPQRAPQLYETWSFVKIYWIRIKHPTPRPPPVCAPDTPATGALGPLARAPAPHATPPPAPRR